MTLYIFDLDGTLVRPNAPGIKIPNNARQQEMIPGVVERCFQLRGEGHSLAIASNQGGVGLGICALDDAWDRVNDAAEQINAADYLICTYHEKAKIQLPHEPDGAFGHYTGLAFWRKPNPGMLLHLMLALEFMPADTVFVGDMDSDQQAAANAGVRFEWAKDFFGWGQ